MPFRGHDSGADRLGGMQRDSSTESPSVVLPSVRSSIGLVVFASAGSPRELLERIVPGDPLGVGELVAQELDAAAYALDADSVRRRTFARIVHAAFVAAGRRHACAFVVASQQSAPGRPRTTEDPREAELTLEAWCRVRVREALEDVRRGEGTQRGEIPAADVFDALAIPLGLDRSALRSACTRFNRLERDQRRAFLRTVVERHPPEDLLPRGGGSFVDLARGVREALESFRGVWGAPGGLGTRSGVVALPARRSR